MPRSYMTGQFVDLEIEMTICWEQTAQIIQKALSYHNIVRYVQDGQERRPVYMQPTVHFGANRFTVEQEIQCELRTKLMALLREF